MHRAWVLAGLLLAPAGAAAERYYPQLSAGGGVGMWVGDVGALAPFGAALQVAADVELAKTLHLRAIYDHGFLSARDESLRGPIGLSLDGGGLLLHHPIFAFPSTRELRVSGDMHVLAGVEHTRLAWDRMPAFRRTEIVVGFGGSFVLRGQQQFDLGVRMLFARAPEAMQSPTVTPSTTLPIDKTLVVELAWRYGR